MHCCFALCDRRANSCSPLELQWSERGAHEHAVAAVEAHDQPPFFSCQSWQSFGGSHAHSRTLPCRAFIPRVTFMRPPGIEAKRRMGCQMLSLTIGLAATIVQRWTM